MTIGLSTTVRNARLTAIKDAIDAGSGAGKLKFYNGARPATGGAGTTLLGTCTLNDTCGTVADGVLTFDVDPKPTDSTADATGTVTWARITDSDDTFVADLSVGTADADIIVNLTSIVAGGVIEVTAAAITEGNA